MLNYSMMYYWYTKEKNYTTIGCSGDVQSSNNLYNANIIHVYDDIHVLYATRVKIFNFTLTYAFYQSVFSLTKTIRTYVVQLWGSAKNLVHRKSKYSQIKHYD